MEVAKGGGEVRRIHIIYFLSSMGRTEQPHLVRVHHLARNGVYLRDVKRWLGELRGKELAEAFAWSYKRRYKSGYVWQDLLDDDLITPISDNEYVLKGSQIHPTPIETCILAEKKASILGEIPLGLHVAENKQQKQKQPSLIEEVQIERYPDFKTNSQEKVSSEISSDRSTLTDENESSKVEEEQPVRTAKQNPDEQNPNYSLHYSLYHNLMNKKSKADTPQNSFSTSSSSSSQSPIKGSKRFSLGASGLFRNLITCGAMDANDGVVVMMNPADKNASKSSNNKLDNKAKICKEDRLGGSARYLGSCWNPQQQQQQKYNAARKSFDEKSKNKSQKTLGELLNQTPLQPLDGPICS